MARRVYVLIAAVVTGCLSAVLYLAFLHSPSIPDDGVALPQDRPARTQHNQGHVPSAEVLPRADDNQHESVSDKRGDGARVSGTVRVKESGEAAARQLVEAWPNRKEEVLQAVTDEAGQYALTGIVPEVEYSLLVRDEEAGLVAMECPVVVARKGEDVTHVDLWLTAGGSISGCVRFQDTRAPLGAARVSAIPHKRGFPPFVRTTKSDGTYTIGLLPALTYWVRCEPPEGATVPSLGQPEGPMRKAEVAMGADVSEIDFLFRRASAVRGRVTGRRGPIEGAEILGICATGEVRGARTVSNADGTYGLVGIAPGFRYIVSASAKEHGGAEMLVATTEDGAEDVDFILSDGASVSGRVVDTKSRLLGGVSVSILQQGRLPNHELKQGVAIPLRRPCKGKADQEGRFQILGVPPGSYRFFVDPTGTKGGLLAAHNPAFTLAEGQSLNDVRVMMTAREDEFVEGTVRGQNGKGLPGVSVRALVPHGGSLGSTVTDEHGRYRLEGVGASVVNIAFKDPEKDWFAPIHLPNVPVGTRDADIVMGEAGSVSGKVVDAATGEPLEEFSIKIGEFYPGGSPYVLSGVEVGAKGGRTNVTGEFAFEGVPPGVVVLTASAEGYARADTAEIDVKAGQAVTGVLVRLEPPGAAEGTVLVGGAAPKHAARIEGRIAGVPGAPVVLHVDATGHFSMEGIPPGDYVATAIVESDPPLVRSVNVKIVPGMVTRVDFNLGEGDAKR